MRQVDDDGARVAEAIHAPNLIEDRFLAEDDVRIAREEIEEIEFLRGQEDFFFLIEDSSRKGFDDEVSVLDIHALLLHVPFDPLIAGDMGFYARDEFGGIERLYDIIVRADAEPANLIDAGDFRRHHQDRDVFLLAKRAADLEAVRIREHNIQNDEIEVLFDRAFFARGAVVFDHDLEAVELQVVALDFRDVLFVLNN